MGHDPLGWVGGTFMESGRRIFIMGYDPFGWGGNIHGIRKRNFIMGYDPLGWQKARRRGARGGERGRGGGGGGGVAFPFKGALDY